MRFDKTIDKHNHEVNAVWGAKAPSLYEERERIATVLLANILGGPGSNSILNRELREKRGLVYGVECSYTQYSDSGIFAISLGCDKSNVETCMEIIRKELLKITQTPLSDSRLRSAKKQLKGQLAISSEGSEAQCLSMGKCLLAYGSVPSEEEDRKKVDSVTAEEIKAVAARIFNPDNMGRLVYL